MDKEEKEALADELAKKLVVEEKGDELDESEEEEYKDEFLEEPTDDVNEFLEEPTDDVSDFSVTDTILSSGESGEDWGPRELEDVVGRDGVDKHDDDSRGGDFYKEAAGGDFYDAAADGTNLYLEGSHGGDFYQDSSRGNDLYGPSGGQKLYNEGKGDGKFYDPRIEASGRAHDEVRSVDRSKLEIVGLQKGFGRVAKEGGRDKRDNEYRAAA